ncbi:MAG: transporter substrate-binding domain-containing protein [Gammaproteobacteria bacterium]|nr:transporter substrate-binding domain-containing protein [Gammaproteobacteria bacterium]NIR85802.1 transporter substrate-binding domain-containing protein [Gammaproteobacteria bacterium]NIR90556.1 transporter substrate-binding domain-containing protein [Gammaproteobacteria bacterium]NIU06937.1 transporter substrate-binding domain-containing protein [Gammaproteobacteria bacterium]NIV53867.1 transporter substrate-binding domain-containing protein [Gammaproteobacteria bacterium]
MKRTVTLLTGALAALLLLPALAQAGETLDRVMRSNTLVLASDPAYPPQSFLDENNEWAGFDIDVAREIANRLGVELEIVTPAWEIITAGRWGGRWDVSVGSMTPTEQRAKVLDFPAVYYFTPASFAVHKESDITSVGQLNGKTIGVCGGCTYENYLNKNLVIDAKGAPPFEYQVDPGQIRAYDTDTSAFDDLRLGPGVRLNAVLSALPTIKEAIENGYPMRVVGDPVFYEPLSVATDKGDPEFDGRIAEVIENMRQDGTLKRLSMKWYGVDLTTAEGT